MLLEQPDAAFDRVLASALQALLVEPVPTARYLHQLALSFASCGLHANAALERVILVRAIAHVHVVVLVVEFEAFTFPFRRLVLVLRSRTRFISASPTFGLRLALCLGHRGSFLHRLPCTCTCRLRFLFTRWP